MRTNKKDEISLLTNTNEIEIKNNKEQETLNQKENYIKTVLSHIRCRKAKAGIEKEIAAHIEDQKETFIKDGYSEWEAENRAVVEMGDPDEVGESLDRIHKPKTDMGILIMVALLSIFGIFMQYLIFSSMEDTTHVNSYMSNSIVCNIAGFGIMMLLFFFDYRYLAKYVWRCYFLYIGIGAVLLWSARLRDFSANLRMGNAVWLLYIPIFCGFIFRFHKQKIIGFIKTMGMLVINSALMVMVGAQSVSVWFVVQAACLITLLIALFAGCFTRDRKIQFGLFGGILLLCGCGFIFVSNGMAAYVKYRLYAILHPQEYPDGINYVSSNIRTMIENTGVTGEHNLGFLGTLPSVHSEYIVTSVFQYFGWLIAGTVILAVLGLFVRCLYVICRQDNPFGFLLGLGLGITLIIKSAMYILANLGIAPGTAVDLPFLSYGFSAAICNYIYMGLILAVHRYSDVFGSDMPEMKIRKLEAQKSKL